MKNCPLRLRITSEMKLYLEKLYEKYKIDEEIDSISDVVRLIINRFRMSSHGKV